MRLSFYTYSYTDRLKMSIPECLKRIKKTGYSGIDVSGTNGNSADPKSFDKARRKLTRETTERLALRVEAIITHGVLTNSLFGKGTPLDLKGTVDLASDIGGKVVTFHMGGYPKGEDRKKVWKKTVDYIRAASDYGAGKHIAMAVDGIWPEWIDSSPNVLKKLFDDVNHENFGVNFDPSYLTLMGVDPVEFAKRFKERIVHAHLKDHRGKYPKWTHLMPGRGEMKYDRVFEALDKLKFQHSVAVECFTNMKFETACDDCYKAMVGAAAKKRVAFKK